MPLRPRFGVNRDGTFKVRLPQEERDLLAALPGQLRELLGAGDPAEDPSLRRLFPAAYTSDAERDAEYRRLMREDLVASRMRSAEVLERTAQATNLTEDEMLGWMGALNDLRLVLGTQLDVSEDMDDVDPDDPRAPRFAVYGYLGYLLELVLRALQGTVED